MLLILLAASFDRSVDGGFSFFKLAGKRGSAGWCVAETSKLASKNVSSCDLQRE